MSAVAEVLTLVREGPTTGAVAFRTESSRRMTAGSLARWRFTFDACVALPPGARIAVAHRWPCDWGNAQGRDPQGENYLTARTSDGSPTRWWAARLHLWHPFDHVLFVEVPDGLARGASVELRFGDGCAGSPGFRVQSFIEEGSPFSLRWRATEADRWTEFAQHRIEVVGAQPEKLVVTVPSRIAPDAPLAVHVRVEDRWGNPASIPGTLAVELRVAGFRQRLDLPPAAFARAELPSPGPGVHRVEASAPQMPALAATSNPVAVGGDAPPLRWGDLHGQSVIGCGARTIDAYYAHARDFAAADVASHQANCFLVSREEWAQTAASTRGHHEPGRFVPLLGVEWSAISSLGGDHNVYFPGDDAELRRCSHEFLPDRGDAATDLRDVDALHRHYRGSDTILALHVGGRTANLDWHDPGLDRLLEVHSTHATSEWFLFDALRRGYRMGVVAGSDGVDGRPAASHPGHMGVRNLRGGMTAILAPELTREAIWRALRERHCYATTGERLLLDFRREGAIMGDEVVAHAGPSGIDGFEVRVEGTAPIERIDFFRDDACIDSFDAWAEAGPSSPRLRVAWRGASAPGNWQRARMDWDGGLRIEGNRIGDVAGYAFDTPDEGVRDFDAQGVRWRSITAGDFDGVVLDLSEPGRGELVFATEPITLRVRLDSVGSAGRRFGLTNPDRSVELRWLPEREAPRSLRVRFADPAPRSGTHAYWVRVRQSDGSLAWSSPIFVTVRDA
ncbi:MAG: DUF3604 domain-containing protein [Burkholderiales bacterium]|nr:DUF3604 domain-containing protein [Burkholderiales bacterium]